MPESIVIVPLPCLVRLLVPPALLIAACGNSAPTVPGGSAGTPPAAATPERIASTAAIADAALPRVRFTTTNGGSVTLPIEVPPEREYEVGLSGWRTLGERGMLFYFPQGTDVGFWMQNTHIDLDIAFVDDALRIIDVQTMQAESLDIHQSPRRYIAGIEAPAGWYAGHAVRPGAQVTFDFDLRAVTGR